MFKFQSGDEKKKLISFRREKTKLKPGRIPRRSMSMYKRRNVILGWKARTNSTSSRLIDNRGIATKKCNRACQEERKEIMGFIDLDKLPSKKVVRQLDCVHYRLYRGLYDCMKDIIHGSYESSESTPNP